MTGRLEAPLRNLRYAVRVLAHAPGFTVTVILTLALAIGANSAVLSAIDAMLLQPLPFPNADRLMRVTQTREGSAELNIAPVRLEDWNSRSSAFEAITGYYVQDVSDTTGEVPERTRSAWVAPRFLDVWAIAPALGRGFADTEHQFGGPSAVLISERYWRARFGGDANVLNRTIRVRNLSAPIIGVMPASFMFPDRDVDLWFPVPVADGSVAAFANPRELTWYAGVGRLKPDATLERARADLAVVQRQLGEQYPDTDRAIGIAIVPLKETVVSAVRGSLWLLFGVVSVLLLIACTNISALLLSRAAQREREISIRFSLGASRRVIVLQLLTETALLALAGAALGLLVAAIATAGFRVLAADLPRVDELGIDGRILVYTLVSALAVLLLCGLFPAFRSTRKSGALRTVSSAQGAPHGALQWLMVGVQVTLSVALLSGAGLLLRSVAELWRVNPGFDPTHVLAFRISGDYSETADYARLVQRIDGALDELSVLPGVDTAATSMLLPGVPNQWPAEFALAEGRADSEPPMIAENRFVSPSYFETMGIPLVAGELCGRHAGAGLPTQVMVSRSFANRYLAGRSAVGLHLVGENSRRIIGIVGDARELGIDREAAPTVYSCYSAPGPTPWFLVRTSGEPMTIASTVRARMNEIEPARSVYDITPLEEQIGAAFAQDRLRTLLLVLFATAALGLACLGIYGTLSYAVSSRRREVGLRLAVGARQRTIVAEFLFKALRVVGLACAAGLVLSFAFTRALSGMLYGVSPADPATLSAVVALVMTVAALAAILPALRAARVDPMQALREE